MQNSGHTDKVDYLTLPDGSKRAYLRHEGHADGPGLVFLAGHGSDMFGTKAEVLHHLAEAADIPFLRFDYFGHGLSDGMFLDGTISRWVDDCVLMLDRLTSGPQILVGSSLGGWLMIRAAQERPKTVAGLVGIAAAPDFTETLIWARLTDQQKQQMKTTGQIALPNAYAPEDVIYPYHLITDGRENLVLDTPVGLDIPLVLLQGMADHEVPWQTALSLAQAWHNDDVQIYLDKGAGHRFSEDTQIEQIRSAVWGLYQRLAADRQSSQSQKSSSL